MKPQIVGWMSKRDASRGADTNYRRLEQDYDFSGGYGLNAPKGWEPVYALDAKDVLILEMYREQHSEALQQLGVSQDPVTRHLAAGIADRWRDECMLLRRYANAAHWWAEASDHEHAEAGDTRPKARCRMIDAEAALTAAGYVFDPPNKLQAAINKVRASAAELGMTIEEWNRKFGT